MLLLESGIVLQLIEKKQEKNIALVEYQDGTTSKAISYNFFNNHLQIGDFVLCNRTAVALELGTGGYDFVLANFSNPHVQHVTSGHIMKLRYTPLQFAVEMVEENKKYHHIYNECESLQGFPVIVGSLHSILTPAVLGALWQNNQVKIAYIMSDAASLPIQLSNNVNILKTKGLITSTITYGHAFGGDWETVNIYSALLTAKYCAKVDMAIVTMGPGIVGTGTKWGHTGLEQGDIVNAVNILQGTPILVPRISFADGRTRHYGISHHTLTVLTNICHEDTIVALPNLDSHKRKKIYGILQEANIAHKHSYVEKDGATALKINEYYKLPMSTMGRKPHEEKEFFEAAAVAGLLACDIAFSQQN